MPLKQTSLFKFGLATLSLSRFDSLNANARMWGGCDNRNTAESRIYRLVTNTKIRELMPTLIPQLNIVTPESVVNIDFSTFATRRPSSEFQVLAFGIQTYLGRSIPLFFDVIRYPILHVGSQNIFIIATIKTLGKLLGFYPRFVLDRGFAIPSLIQFFIEESIIFYVRSKKGKLVTIQAGMKEYKDTDELDNLVAAGKIKQKDVMVTVYGKPMRLVISPPDKDNPEPWYILTNDMTTPRKKVLETYYHRFEIEETFKDLKHVKGLEVLQMAKETTFKTLMWFMILGCWIGYLVEGVVRKAAENIKTLDQNNKKNKHLNKSPNKHKTLSFFRSFFEQIQRCFYFISRLLTRKSPSG